MTIELLWTVPVRGDGRDGDPSLRRRGDWSPDQRNRFAPSVRDERPGRFNYYDYLTQIARASEAAGFDGLFVPYEPGGEESWVVASSLAYETPRLSLVTEFQPGFSTAVYTGKLALSFQRFFANRLGWKLALDGDPAVQRSVGDGVAPADRAARAEELLTVTKGAWSEEPFTYQGQYFEAGGTGFFGRQADTSLRPDHRIPPRPYPKIYLDGESDAALELSGRHADVHVLSSAEPSAVEQAISRHRERAAAHGRQVAYGLRLGIVARETAKEAWRTLDRLMQSSTGGDPSNGHSELQVDDQLVVGLSALGFSAEAGLVGDFGEVADRLKRYVASGITTFVLDGLPRLEEAYRLGERVLPLLDDPGLVAAGSGSSGAQA